MPTRIGIASTSGAAQEAGKEGGVLRVTIPALSGWDMWRTPDLRASPFETGQTVTVFSARGGSRTRRLALEWDERDGSRWIAVIPVTEKWQRYRLAPTDFHGWGGGPQNENEKGSVRKTSSGSKRGLPSPIPAHWTGHTNTGSRALEPKPLPALHTSRGFGRRVAQERFGRAGSVRGGRRVFYRVPRLHPGSEAGLLVFSEYPLLKCQWDAKAKSLLLQVGGTKAFPCKVEVRPLIKAGKAVPCAWSDFGRVTARAAPRTTPQIAGKATPLRQTKVEDRAALRISITGDSLLRLYEEAPPSRVAHESPSP